MRLVRWMNGSVGRTVRVGAGLALIGLGIVVGGVAGVVLAVIGLVPLIAGAAGVCLLAPLSRVLPGAR